MKRLLIGILLACMLGGSALALEQINLPLSLDVIMLAGADYELQVINKTSTGTPINISDAGYTYAAQFRAGPAPTGALFATYSTSKVDPTGGVISVRLSRAQTTALSGKFGVWDLLQTNPAGKRSYLIRGKCNVQTTTTRIP